ncbi:MAG: HNH endonuclease [Acidimicrobiia bacterium]
MALTKAERAEKARLLAEGLKLCRKCSTVRPVADFSANASRADGLDPRCRPCRAAYAAAYRAANPERLREQEVAYRAANADRIREYKAAHYAANAERLRKQSAAYHATNADRRREQMAAYKAANADRIREQKVAYNAANADRIREQKVAYNAANADRIREQKAAYRQTPEGKARDARANAKRRAALSASDATLTAEEWATILDRFDHRCYVCGAPWEELEHLTPLSRGGTHSAENVRPSCTECNRGTGGKWTRDLHEWLPERLAFLREQTRPVAA